MTAEGRGEPSTSGLRYEGPPIWVVRAYHAITCTDTICDPSCPLGVPAWSGGVLMPVLHRCPALSREYGPWTVVYGPDGYSKCSCRARVPHGAFLDAYTDA